MVSFPISSQSLPTLPTPHLLSFSLENKADKEIKKQKTKKPHKHKKPVSEHKNQKP